MTLTFRGGPLATPAPTTVNYELNGPAHKLLMTPFPRRVRAEIAQATLFDTVQGQLVHESNMLAVLYVPRSDVLVPLEPSQTTTHCPFKGDASYFHAAGSDDAAWAYEEPLEAAAWLQDLIAFDRSKLDAIFDEDEPVRTHLRDPFTRVDARRSSRPVRVTAGGELIAASERAVVLSETGLPNRWYLPLQDVRAELTPTDTTSHCPYKGDARYWSVAGVQDAAFGYEAPLDGVQAIAGLVSFLGEGIEVEV